MNKRWTMCATAAWLAVASTAWAIDQIKTTSKEKPMLRGKIVSISPQMVDLEPTGAASAARQVPVNEIVSILFEDEPGPLMTAQKHILDGEYLEALTALEKVQAEEAKRREIAEEIEFCKAYCTAQMALAGNGNVVDAGKQMFAFLKNCPNSFHFFQATELMGNLLVANGAYDKAETFYATLAKAPWPDYKMRAGTAMGRALVAQNKLAEASKAFDDVLNSDASGDLAEVQRLAAKVGKARCMAASDKVDQAIKMLDDIIAKADSENMELHALAYNALGTALRKAGKPKEALLAFLHVDLLYSGVPEAHAEALANLEQLFTEIHKPDHARRARAVLDERYKDSRWAKAGAK